MRNALLIVTLVAGAFAAGWHGKAYWHADTASASTEETGAAKPLYWVAPMDPNYRRDKPGKSPMGMDLIPVYAEASPDADDGAVRISPVTEHNLGVRSAEVTRGPLQLPIRTAGTLVFDEDRLSHVHSRVDGWIERLHVKAAGDPVRQGQKLFDLYSPALVNAQEEYLAALRSGNAGLLQASRERLRALGLTGPQIDRLHRERKVEQLIGIHAPQDGVVERLQVRQGMFIQPATEVMSVASLESLWLIAEVFERQAGWVRPGQPVEIAVAAQPGRIWRGQVDYLYPMLDAKTRTLQVRVRIDNPDGVLKPNMFATLTLEANIGEAVISVPREAVIRSGRHDRVVVAEGDGRYRPAPVRLGVEAGDRVQILEGLAPGQRVVTSAQFLIDSESRIDVSLAGLTSADQPGAAPDRVRVEGRVESLMPAHGMLTLSHGPVAAWQWPAMTMDFVTADGLSLAGIEAGQPVRVEISRHGESDYRISAIEPASHRH